MTRLRSFIFFLFLITITTICLVFPSSLLHPTKQATPSTSHGLPEQPQNNDTANEQHIQRNLPTTEKGVEAGQNVSFDSFPSTNYLFLFHLLLHPLLSCAFDSTVSPFHSLIVSYMHFFFF